MKFHPFGRAAIVLSAAAALLSLPLGAAEPAPLIPRDVIFGNPERHPADLPRRKRLAWIAPDKKNVLQVWVKTIGKDDDKRHQRQEARHPPVLLGWNDEHLLYLQDNDGDENFHLYASNLNRRDAGPDAVPGRRAPFPRTRPEHPDKDPGRAEPARQVAIFDVCESTSDRRRDAR